MPTVLAAPAPRRAFSADALVSYFSHLHAPSSSSSSSSAASSEGVDPSSGSFTPTSEPSSHHTDDGHDGHDPTDTALPEANKSAPRSPSRIGPDSPPWPAYRGYQEFSFAHATMRVRLPTILGNALADTVSTLTAQWDAARAEDLAACVARVEALLEDLRGNRKLRPIVDDGADDVALWNKELAQHFQDKDFMTAPWVFAEAYTYRRLHECFATSRFWKDYDPFFHQKCDTFTRSGDAVLALAARFAPPLSPAQYDNDVRALFLELAQVCLWGNATDLSLLITMSEDQIRALQSTGGTHLAAASKNILANHLPQLWTTLSSPSVRGRRVDIVLDNAGFELFCDCLFADFLIQAGLASHIHFHGKRIAWFVSDVTRQDWAWLLTSTTAHGRLFPHATTAEKEALRTLGARWREYERAGVWVYEQHPHWCTGYTFWDLPTEAPCLLHDLSQSALVLFKGDLNHRKLTYDCAAPPTTPFATAIGPMARAGLRVCSLRTIKSDVVVGLEDESVAARLDRDEPGWRISGKYAVVLLSEGRDGETPHPA